MYEFFRGGFFIKIFWVRPHKGSVVQRIDSFQYNCSGKKLHGSIDATIVVFVENQAYISHTNFSKKVIIHHAGNRGAIHGIVHPVFFVARKEFLRPLLKIRFKYHDMLAFFCGKAFEFADKVLHIFFESLACAKYHGFHFFRIYQVT